MIHIFLGNFTDNIRGFFYDRMINRYFFFKGKLCKVLTLNPEPCLLISIYFRFRNRTLPLPLLGDKQT